jgi:hypothetical protein
MQTKKTHWKKVFNSDYLGSCDLDDGKDLRAVIKSVEIKKVKGNDGKEQERNVATFTDSKIKPMILNATNCKIVKRFAKSVYINDWNNIPVQIYIKDDIKAFGDITEGLRIREIQPALNKPKLTRDLPAWENVIKYVREGKPLSDIEKKYDISEVKDEILREAV